jgi:hypothetical protein
VRRQPERYELRILDFLTRCVLCCGHLVVYLPEAEIIETRGRFSIRSVETRQLEADKRGAGGEYLTGRPGSAPALVDYLCTACR